MAKIEANYPSLFFFPEIESQKIGNARGLSHSQYKQVLCGVINIDI